MSLGLKALGRLSAAPITMAILLCLAVSACSTNYSTVDRGGGKKIIYTLSEEQALQVAYATIASSFPGRKIEQIDGPVKGYTTYTRVVLDTYSQQVLAIPATGRRKDGSNVDGFYFEVSGSGSSGTGMARNSSFFERLQSNLDNTGQAVEVVELRPRVK